jgi:hypothetical protein
MKKDGIYRFSLQFRADTEEQIRAGELLERLGNKKSQVIVAALNEYMKTHPELEKKDCTFSVKTIPLYSREHIELIVHEILQNQMGNMKVPLNMPIEIENLQSNSTDDVVQMLNNIDMFN